MAKVKSLSKATPTPRHVLKKTKPDPFNVKFTPPVGVDRTLTIPRANYPKPKAWDIKVQKTQWQEEDLGRLMQEGSAAGWKDYTFIHGHYTVFARKTA